MSNRVFSRFSFMQISSLRRRFLVAPRPAALARAKRDATAATERVQLRIARALPESIMP